MGWHVITAKSKNRAKVLGAWAGNPLLDVNERDGYEGKGGPFFVSASTRPGAPPCGRGGIDGHDYRHYEMVKFDWKDEETETTGGYICFKDNDWDKRTAKQTAPEFGIMKCVDCGDTYDPAGDPPEAVRLQQDLLIIEKQARVEVANYDKMIRNMADGIKTTDALFKKNKKSKHAKAAADSARQHAETMLKARNECVDRFDNMMGRIRLEQEYAVGGDFEVADDDDAAKGGKDDHADFNWAALAAED